MSPVEGSIAGRGVQSPTEHTLLATPSSVTHCSSSFSSTFSPKAPAVTPAPQFRLTSTAPSVHLTAISQSPTNGIPSTDCLKSRSVAVISNSRSQVRMSRYELSIVVLLSLTSEGMVRGGRVEGEGREGRGGGCGEGENGKVGGEGGRGLGDEGGGSERRAAGTSGR